MTLSPCPRCRRHVLVDEQRCPFCGTARWSRIAVLAGVLALPACGGTTTPAATPDPSHVSNHAPRIATAKIAGVVTNTRTQGPLVNGYVRLIGPDGVEHTTGTDENGRYEFANLEAGAYVVSAPPTRHGADRGDREEDRLAGDTVVVKDGENVQHDLSTWQADPRLKLPYGAPPLRSRLV